MARTPCSIAPGPRSVVHPATRNRDTDPAGALVVEALPGKRVPELGLDHRALRVEGVEEGLVVCSDRTVDV